MHLPKRWIDRRLYEYMAVNVGAHWPWATPILVYQMGRVGSSSVRNALFRSRDPATRLVLMSHEFYPVRNRRAEVLDVDPSDRGDVETEIAHAQAVFRRLPWRRKLKLRFREKFYSEMIHRNIVARRRPAKVITLVRDPIANNISMFFQVFRQYADGQREMASYSPNELVQLFLDRYMHSRPLIWFDTELRPMLGIDVYEHPFPTEQGYTVLKQGHLELLVLRCDESDTVKERAIGEFIGIRDFHMVRSNVTARKASAATYAKFQQEIRLPDAYIDRMVGSKYATHFYREGELAEFRRRWQTADRSSNG